MKAGDIFAGPIVRRAQTDRVAVWLATNTPLEIAVSVRAVGDPTWLGVSGTSQGFQVCENLWIHLLLAVPVKGTFPTSKLLEYSIAVVDEDGAEDHDPFAAIVAADDLAYPGYTLPTFYLQGGGTRLNALYASCRKVHDDKGGDAMADGDSLVFNNVDTLAVRPAVLCLTGDQIYADDLHDETFDAVTAVAAKLEGSAKETLPKGLALPGKGARQAFVTKEAFFTSTYAKNHVITFAEYAAMYGLAWSKANWPSGPFSAEVQNYVGGLPKVRRLMANTPTYMIFDDHEVTDDWNLSLQWFANVTATPLGSRILMNGLYAFWLFQGWGNDPDRDQAQLPKLVAAGAKRLESPVLLEAELSTKSRANGWEFFTPTYPFIYFLDTRTQRGHYDGISRKQTKAPAYLKSIDAWKVTLDNINRLLKRQGGKFPLVIVAPAPIWGYESIDALQRNASAIVGPYPFDNEGWAANRGHFLTFLLQCGNTDVVVLSGDVHYSFTTTAKFNVFDSDFFRSVQAAFPAFPYPATGSGGSATYQFLYSSRFLQLTASAAKNHANPVLAAVSRVAGAYGYVIEAAKGGVEEGVFKNGDLMVVVPATIPKALKKVELDKYKPLCALHQHVNDSANSPYIGDHNIGYVSITGRKVENSFLVKGKQDSKRTWDFASDSAWAPP